MVHIVTFKNEGRIFTQESGAKAMVMTVRQAGLLACRTFSRLVKLAMKETNPILLMTPLAGACFSKDDMQMQRMTEELNTELTEVLIIINESCQSGGHYLDNSDGSVAACAAISATRGLKDEDVKRSIVTKIVKQYFSRGKELDAIKLSIVSKYATGGIPSEFSYDNLLSAFKSAQSAPNRLKSLNAVKTQESILSNVTMPSTSSKRD